MSVGAVDVVVGIEEVEVPVYIVEELDVVEELGVVVVSLCEVMVDATVTVLVKIDVIGSKATVEVEPCC